jgi:TPR repeat protein
MAASRGHTAAQFSLGNNLLYGNACTPDSIKGLKWLQRAAEGGQPEAEYVLALEMLGGARLAQQRDSAIKWLRRSADADFGVAKLKLAWLYATTPDENLRNPALALSYLNQIPDQFIDRLSVLEVRAAVAAAAGRFDDAVRSQKEAIDEADRYELPKETLEQELKAYKERRSWIGAAL